MPLPLAGRLGRSATTAAASGTTPSGENPVNCDQVPVAPAASVTCQEIPAPLSMYSSQRHVFGNGCCDPIIAQTASKPAWKYVLPVVSGYHCSMRGPATTLPRPSSTPETQLTAPLARSTDPNPWSEFCR